jgi:hypothetical protein
MFVEQKKQQIVMLMDTLKDKKREKFAHFLATEFTDEDLQDLSHDNADKMLAFLANI